MNHGKRELRWNKKPNFLAGAFTDAYLLEPQDTLCADMLPDATRETLTQIRVINTEDAKPVFLLSMQDGYVVLLQLVSILDTIPLHKGD